MEVVESSALLLSHVWPTSTPHVYKRKLSLDYFCMWNVAECKGCGGCGGRSGCGELFYLVESSLASQTLGKERVW